MLSCLHYSAYPYVRPLPLLTPTSALHALLLSTSYAFSPHIAFHSERAALRVEHLLKQGGGPSMIDPATATTVQSTTSGDMGDVPFYGSFPTENLDPDQQGCLPIRKRWLLGGCAGLLFLLVLSFLPQQQATDNLGTHNAAVSHDLFGSGHFEGGGPLRQPPLVANASLALEVGVLRVSIPNLGLAFTTRAFNGMVPGPTWKVRKGEQWRLSLTNTLEAEIPDELPHNTFRRPNSSNVHLHGAYVSGEARADNMHVHVAPNETHEYVYDDKSAGGHASGLVWYHSHMHGSSSVQLGMGMHGAIIVEDEEPSLMPPALESVVVQFSAVYLHPSSKMNLELVAQHVNKPTGTITSTLKLDLDNSKNLERNYLLCNWQYQPHVSLPARTFVRLRLLNALAKDAVHIGMEEEGMEGACSLLLIAIDGVYLEKARPEASIYMAPGARADMLVHCDRPGSHYLRTLADERVMGAGIASGLFWSEPVSAGESQASLATKTQRVLELRVEGEKGSEEDQQLFGRVGHIRDTDGCIPSAGYVWCAALESCVRPWEYPCPSENGEPDEPVTGGSNQSSNESLGASSEGGAKRRLNNWYAQKYESEYWGGEGNNNDGHYEDREERMERYGPVVYELHGSSEHAQKYGNEDGGAERQYGENRDGHYEYREERMARYGPVVYELHESELAEVSGVEKVAEEMVKRNFVGGDKDVHGCIPSAGYSWCPALKSCVRPWEQPCPNIVLPPRPAYLQDLMHYKGPLSKQSVVLSDAQGGMGIAFGDGASRAYTPGAIAANITMNAPQEWTLESGETGGPNTGYPSHPYHQHINHFQVVSGVDPTGGLLWRTGDFRDTVDLHANAKAVIRFQANIYTGAMLVHCHNTLHADRGMMAVAQVLPPAM